MNEKHNRPEEQITIPSLGHARHRHGPGDVRSYLEQVTRATWLPGEPELVPIDDEPRRAARSWFVVSAWNPGGAPTTLEENLARHEGRTQRLLNAGVRFRETAVSAPDRTWAEQAIALEDADRAEAVAQQVGAPAYVEYSGTCATAWRTGFPEYYTRAVIGARRRTGCPMLRGPAGDGQCVPQGGPWVSASRERAAQWAAHRRLLTTVLGCGYCGGGHSTGGDRIDSRRTGARFVREISAASRWGDPLVLPDDESPDRPGRQ